MIAGLLLAVGCAIAGSVAMLLKQRGAVAAPVVLARHPVRSAIGLFGSKWWTVGWLVALCAWLLHVGALSLASLSIVQALISGGLVFLAILAERFFGFQLGRRQWIGLLVTAVGLAPMTILGVPGERRLVDVLNRVEFGNPNFRRADCPLPARHPNRRIGRQARPHPTAPTNP